MVTGGGTGMGRELVRQLAAEGCDVAMCDVAEEAMAETAALCAAASPSATVTTFVADVADERQVLAFRDAVARDHATDRIHLLFNNAGIGGGGSMVLDSRAEWDATFAVCWGGVYHGTRAFLPMLLAADEGHVVNTSSVNGFWACLGPNIAHTAYSAAKFAVKGFTEALIVDFRLNAPHVRAAVVMPGHVGTCDRDQLQPAPRAQPEGPHRRAGRRTAPAAGLRRRRRVRRERRGHPPGHAARTPRSSATRPR